MKCPFVIKICNMCKKILVAYNGNFNKDKRRKYGLDARCKECTKKYNKKYYEDNKEDLNKKGKEYREKNKKRLNEHRRERYKKNKEKEDEYNKKYYKKYYENNKEKIKEHIKQWKEDNPEKVFNHANRRRQLEENQGNGITKDQWLEMMEFFEFKCAYSGIQLGKDNRSIDHIVALNNGGENEVWNCVPMHRNYNTSKHANDMLEWYIQQEFYSEERLNKIYEWQEYAFEKWGNQ